MYRSSEFYVIERCIELTIITILIFIVRYFLIYVSSRKWIKTEAKIMDFKFEDRYVKGSGGDGYHAIYLRVIYQYVVSGKIYTNRNVSLSECTFPFGGYVLQNKKLARKYNILLRNKKSVTIFFNPKKPSVCCINIDAEWKIILIPMSICLLLFLGMWFFSVGWLTN